VQLGEELDAILAREQLIHYTAEEMIATKAKSKNVRKQLSKSRQKVVKSCQKLSKVVKKL
jgi:hypothetical protein